jgi:hypothetical protein
VKKKKIEVTRLGLVFLAGRLRFSSCLSERKKTNINKQFEPTHLARKFLLEKNKMKFGRRREK